MERDVGEPVGCEIQSSFKVGNLSLVEIKEGFEGLSAGGEGMDPALVGADEDSSGSVPWVGQVDGGFRRGGWRMGREGGQLQHLRGVQGVLGLAKDEG